MDSDRSKENNFQPFHNTRNPVVMGLALQARQSDDSQAYFMQQKREFDNAIRNYSGSDHLDPFYKYLCWLEQTYPEEEHAIHLAPILEQCVRKFENDRRYYNDYRFCKVLIKFIDMQDNRVELYRALHSKGICKSLAEFYRAWAYYYEADSDFKNADIIYNLGKKEYAQPIELKAAHESLIYAAGQFTIHGRTDARRLLELRQSLVSLRSFNGVQVVTSNISGAYATAIPNSNHVSLHGHLDYHEPLMSVGSNRSFIASPKTKPVNGGADIPPHMRGIKLPPNFCTESHDKDLEDWRSPITLPDPEEPNKTRIPMYCKMLVYSEPDTEYSIEEIRSRRYFDPHKLSPHVASIQQIPQNNIVMEQDGQVVIKLDEPFIDYAASNRNQLFHVKESPVPLSPFQESPRHSFLHLDTSLLKSPDTPTTQALVANNQQVLENRNDYLQLPANFNNSLDIPSMYMPHSLFTDTPPNIRKPHISNFNLFDDFHESGHQNQSPQLKVSAMKTPLNVVSDEDLAETGSRGGLDNAAAAQPTDGAKRLALSDYDEDSAGLDVTNTQVFSSKITETSTPIKDSVIRASRYGYPDYHLLSAIPEERTLSNTTASSSCKQHAVPLGTVNEGFYRENMKVNEELRLSLLGKIMDCETAPSTPTTELDIPPFALAVNEVLDDEDVPYSELYERITVKEHVPYPILHDTPSDPFTSNALEKLLQHVQFPGRHRQGYITINTQVRLMVKKEACIIGNDSYIVDKLLGKGTFGSVFRATRYGSKYAVALKVQKPPNKWEFYICRELQARLLHHPLRNRFMNVHIGYFSSNSSVLLSDFSPYGSLLDATNLLRTRLKHIMKENSVIHFTMEMLKIVKAMHDVKVIHADIKPDNFLILILDDNTAALQLIDFGCSIDMSLYPQGTMFTRRVTTEDFVCCEMLDGRPWSYHTDLFCVAATTHVLLFDKYIQVKKKDNHWSISQRFLRYWRADLWSTFFSSLLNMQNGLPDLEDLSQQLNSCLDMVHLKTEMREFINTIKNR